MVVRLTHFLYTRQIGIDKLQLKLNNFTNEKKKKTLQTERRTLLRITFNLFVQAQVESIALISFPFLSHINKIYMF